ncbi:type II toxin-antitoxin system YafQ family toxin [Anaerobiospirillum thomasii]|uniref:type II toxin-antitoxin system YafQ family toxin n=1 Tax=Anaerobiospirillum thomasii TaxID=179995 RepID=UPI000DE5A7E0
MSFTKNLKNLKNQPNLKKTSKNFKEVLDCFESNKSIPSKFINHKLNDDKYYKDCWECHLLPDVLVIYQYIDNRAVILFINIGTHEQLF